MGADPVDPEIKKAKKKLKRERQLAEAAAAAATEGGDATESNDAIIDQQLAAAAVVNDEDATAMMSLLKKPKRDSGLKIATTNDASANGHTAAKRERASAAVVEAPVAKASSSAATATTAVEKVKSDPLKVSQANSECVRLYVGNISFKATDSDMHSMFSRSGKILGLHWVTDKQTGLFYGSCMVDFDCLKSANDGLRCNNKELCGRALKVSIAGGHVTQSSQISRYNSKPEAGNKVQQTHSINDISAKPPGCHTIFLGNVSFDITDEIVQQTFAECGTFIDIRWVEKEGVFKGCGFIEFEEDDAVDKAVLLSGTTVMGRKMKIDYAPNKENPHAQ